MIPPEFGFGQTAMENVTCDCVRETAAIIAQGNTYAQFCLSVGLVLGCVIGAVCLFIGMKYYGSTK